MAKILVIDDEQGIRSLLDTLLRRKGYDVVLADGGRKGLELFRREQPDVIVLDLNMPEMDGVASCSRSAVSIPISRSSFRLCT
jgi:CheY-like chemotaxis protein